MSDPVDIQSVLQNGYFTTSGAKIAQSPPPPSSPIQPRISRPDYARTSPVAESRRPRTRPPPPSVEDECDSLAKEFLPVKSGAPDEEIVPHRGHVDQYPVLLEVHEYNPERRFVLVPNSADASQCSERRKGDESDSDSRRTERNPDERPTTPKTGDTTRSGWGDSIPRRPAGERRRSRPDLPNIDTGMRRDRTPEHHRTQSAAGPRPKGWSSVRSSAPVRDDMLSPDIIKNGSGRRERVYHGSSSKAPDSGRPTQQRSYSTLAEDRRRDRPRRQDSLSPAQGSRSESTPDPRKLRRRPSGEQIGESRYREEPGSARGSRRDTSTPYKRESGQTTPTPSTPKPRGPREDPASQPREPRRRQGTTASIHQDTPPIPIPDRERGPRPDDRPHLREPSISKQKLSSSAPRDDSIHPRASATFPLTGEEFQSQPPRSDDLLTGRGGRSPVLASRPPYSASSSDILPGSSVSSERASEATKITTPVSAKTSPSWPPKFDPERDGLPTDQEVGSYRRYSEGRGGNGIPVLPECQRKEPVAGKMDWLTLPRTDLNICPDCYQGVFGDTEYRTLFQPMLRPSDKAIPCDFGSSPWHRIAWLLTLKNEHPDLRLLRQVDNIGSSSRNQICPGGRKALRNWYTIRDPYTRRPIPNFTVCQQCASMVEVLLPNLAGIFTPVDSRLEPMHSVCALHFKPQRKRFALYFDTLETTADKASRLNEPPNIEALAAKIDKLSCVDECREDSPIPDTYWYTMQFLPDFTVCADCFDTVVRPRLASDVLARNFYKNPQRVSLATCQLYSERMREIFRKACRRNDPQYLQAKVEERLAIEAEIHGQLVKLDRAGHDDAWVEEQVGKLIQEWRKWE